MQENRWKTIWNSKSASGDIPLNKNEYDLFCYLKKVDGFDVNVKNEESYFTAFYDAWADMALKAQECAEKEINSVYEVGCGSGVNLFLFSQRNKKIKLGGIDYSSGLIDIAKKVVKSDDLVCGEAKDITIDNKYDFVIAESVFQYFSSIEYAEDVLRKMISKAKFVTYLGELHDEELRDEWLENRRKNMKDYDIIYEGLDKMFYKKAWIEAIAKEYNKKVIFTKVENDEYWNSKYIYNCYIY